MNRNQEPPGSAAVQVLVVDDNEDAATSLVMLLELEDIVAATASDGPAALHLLDELSPAIFLIDIGLPGMDGFELARRVRERIGVRAATLIALTGRDASDQHHPAAATFDQFWTKPFDPRKLLQEVKAILSNPRSPAQSSR